eukprot:SM000036S13265  [mRNA]  locus=s36:199685:208700:+ [translate_table: standard]
MRLSELRRSSCQLLLKAFLRLPQAEQQHAVPLCQLDCQFLVPAFIGVQLFPANGSPPQTVVDIALLLELKACFRQALLQDARSSWCSDLCLRLGDEPSPSWGVEARPSRPQHLLLRFHLSQLLPQLVDLRIGFTSNLLELVDLGISFLQAPLRLPKKISSALAAASSACLMMLLALSVNPGGFQLHVGSLKAFVGLLDMDRRREISALHQCLLDGGELGFGFVQALGHALTPLVYRALSAVNVALQQRTLAPEHLHLPFYVGFLCLPSINNYHGPDTGGTIDRGVLKQAVLKQGNLLLHEIPHLHDVCPFGNKLLLNVCLLFKLTGTFSARLGYSLGSSKVFIIEDHLRKADLQSDIGEPDNS